MNAKDIVALLESITESDTETAINSAVDIGYYLNRQKVPTGVDENAREMLLLTALYKLGKLDAERGRVTGVDPGRPIIRGRYPT